MTDTKKCSKCGIVKPLGEFSRRATASTGRRSRCKACKAALNRRYHKANLETVHERRRRYHKANPGKVYERCRRYREANPEKVRERRRRYREANPGKRAKDAHLRRARKNGAPGTFTEAQFQVLCDHYGNVCLRCGEPKPLTRDHVVPLVDGGSNDISNIQPLCGPCNSSKGTKSTDYRTSC